jgi:hypothetical protein
MRDDQVRRYARHVLVPDIGGLGQTALLVATARMGLRDDPDAALIAAMFLAAGGVGKLELRGATDAELAQVAARGPDTSLVANTPTEPLALDTQPPPVPRGTEVVLLPKPSWWPSAPEDETAFAYWRGSLAATRWMATIANG